MDVSSTSLVAVQENIHVKTEKKKRKSTQATHFHASDQIVRLEVELTKRKRRTSPSKMSTDFESFEILVRLVFHTLRSSGKPKGKQKVAGQSSAVPPREKRNQPSRASKKETPARPVLNSDEEKNNVQANPVGLDLRLKASGIHIYSVDSLFKEG